MLCIGDRRMPTRPAPIASATAVGGLDRRSGRGSRGFRRTRRCARSRRARGTRAAGSRWRRGSRRRRARPRSTARFDAATNVGRDLVHLVGGEGVRHGEGRPCRWPCAPAPSMAIALGRDDAVGAGDVGVRDAAAVHDLHDDLAAARVHGVGDAPPAGDLLVGDDAGLARVGPRLVRRVGALGDDQAEGGALAVVLDDEVAGNAGVAGAHTGEGRHDDAVGQVQVAERGGGEEIHGWFLSGADGVRGRGRRRGARTRGCEGVGSRRVRRSNVVGGGRIPDRGVRGCRGRGCRVCGTVVCGDCRVAFVAWCRVRTSHDAANATRPCGSSGSSGSGSGRSRQTAKPVRTAAMSSSPWPCVGGRRRRPGQRSSKVGVEARALGRLEHEPDVLAEAVERELRRVLARDHRRALDVRVGGVGLAAVDRVEEQLRIEAERLGSASDWAVAAVMVAIQALAASFSAVPSPDLVPAHDRLAAHGVEHGLHGGRSGPASPAASMTSFPVSAGFFVPSIIASTSCSPARAAVRHDAGRVGPRWCWPAPRRRGVRATSGAVPRRTRAGVAVEQDR